MTMMEMIRVDGGYGAVKVLHGIDIAVEQGAITVLLGANGAGKTTTLRAASGMLKVSGTVKFDDRDITGLPAYRVERLGVSHVAQGRGTFNELSVEDNLRVGAYHRRGDRAGVRTDMNRWYETFPRLADRRHQAAGSMSGGEQQMLAIARALMARPRLLLLDEPSLGLAPLIIEEMFSVLAALNRELGTTMFIVEQNAELALSVAQHAFVLEAGRVVASGSPAEMRNDHAVRRAYLGY